MHSALGDVYFREGKIGEAEKEYASAQQLNPANARAWFGRYRVYSAVSMYRHAHDYLVKAHELDPADRDIQLRWFRTLTPREQIAELQKYLEAPAGDDPELRENLQHRLEFLKLRQDQPRRACSLVKAVAKTEAPLEQLLIDPRHIRGWGLKASLNGNTSRLLIDTGASGILINRRAAEKARIARVASTTLGGIGDKGPASGYTGYADSIKIGDLEFQNCLVEVSDKRSVVDEDGLIGTDVFSAFLITLDFPDQKLKLGPLPQTPDEKPEGTPELKTQGDAESASEKTETSKESQAGPKPPMDSSPRDSYVAPEMKSYTRIFRFGHDLLIPTKIGDAPAKLFLIDTGAFANVMSPDAAREVTKVRSDENTFVKGISGNVKEVSRADKVTILFSHYRQENQNIVTFDLSNISRDAGTEVSGILGFDMLRLMEIKIDYRDGLVDFLYDKKRLGLQ